MARPSLSGNEPLVTQGHDAMTLMTLELFTSAVLVVTVGTSRLFPRPTRSRCCNRGRVRRRLSAAKAIERFVKRTKSLAHLANKLSMPQEKRDRVRNMVEHGRSLKISTRVLGIDKPKVANHTHGPELPT